MSQWSRVFTVESPDVKMIQENTRLSQAMFAAMIVGVKADLAPAVPLPAQLQLVDNFRPEAGNGNEALHG